MPKLPDELQPKKHSRRKRPILLRRSQLTETLHVYAIFDYNIELPDEEGGDVAVVAKSRGKEDVTDQFLSLCAEQWPHLVEEGYIEVLEPEPDDAGEEAGGGSG